MEKFIATINLDDGTATTAEGEAKIFKSGRPGGYAEIKKFTAADGKEYRGTVMFYRTGNNWKDE